MTVQAVSSALCLKACWSSSLVSATGGLKPWRWQGTQNCRLSVGKPGCGTNRSGTGPPWGRLVHSKMVAVLLRMLSPSVLSERQIGTNPIIFFPVSPLGTNRPCALLCTLHEHPFAIISTATNSTSLSGPVSDRVGFARLDT
jgi:hypothetical protein